MEYPWEAPVRKLEENTSTHVADLIKFLVSEDASIDGFMDMVAEEFGDNPSIGVIDWSEASLRLESWPLGDNRSRMVISVSMDLLGGRRTITFEMTLLLKKEAEKYDISLEDFRFDFK